MKRFLAILFIIIIVHPFFASDASEEDVSNAFVAITDLGFISAANFISLNRNEFDSIAIRVSKTTSLPEAILFDGADLGEFLSYFKSKSKNTNFFTSFVPSIDPIVIARLEENNWEKGDAIVTGAAALVFPDNLNFQKILSDVNSGIYPKVGASFNFLVTGALFEDDINIKGLFVVSAGSDGVPNLIPLRLVINEKDYDLSFFERAPLLLTMKDDI